MIAKNNQFVYTILFVYRFISEYVNKTAKRTKRSAVQIKLILLLGVNVIVVVRPIAVGSVLSYCINREVICCTCCRIVDIEFGVAIGYLITIEATAEYGLERFPFIAQT